MRRAIPRKVMCWPHGYSGRSQSKLSAWWDWLNLLLIFIDSLWGDFTWCILIPVSSCTLASALCPCDHAHKQNQISKKKHHQTNQRNETKWGVCVCVGRWRNGEREREIESLVEVAVWLFDSQLNLHLYLQVFIAHWSCSRPLVPATISIMGSRWGSSQISFCFPVLRRSCCSVLWVPLLHLLQEFTDS